MSVSGIPVLSPSRPASRQGTSRPSSRLSTRGPMSPGLSSSTSRSTNAPATPGSAAPPSAFTNGRTPGGSARRQSSYDQLSVIAAAIGDGESHLPLPLPVANGSLGPPVSIREGVPEEYGDIQLQKTRSRSPTRSISRIPVSSVGHARALAEDGGLSASTSLARPNSSLSPLPSPLLNASSLDPLTPTSLSADTQLSPSPSSPNFGPSAFKPSNRKSLGSGNTTKVLAELQAGVSNARNALENTKNQLRTSQRQVAQLTRQNEDLKDGRERMRMEIENLNNVVARKERLLQELLDRARKAEAEALSFKGQLKTETTASKSAIKEMEKQLSEAAAVSQKSHREYVTLSESVKGMTGSWRGEMEAVRREIGRREEEHRREGEAMARKYETVVKLVQGYKAERAQLDSLKAESRAVDQDMADLLQPHLGELLQKASQSSSDSAEALKIAQGIQDELTRIRRLMRVGHGPTPSVSGFSSTIHPSPATPNLASISE